MRYWNSESAYKTLRFLIRTSFTAPGIRRVDGSIHPSRIGEATQLKEKNVVPFIMLCAMAGNSGKSRPPGNQNGFRHGLAAVNQHHLTGAPIEVEKNIRADI
jgi:hypothetical protein